MKRIVVWIVKVAAVVSVIFIVDLSTAEAANLCYCATEKICPLGTDIEQQYLDFWSKFRDTVMPKPDEPQNNNPPKEEDPEPPPSDDESESKD